MSQIVGWIGTGVMGLQMCHHLLKQNIQLLVYSRTISKCQSLIESGARLVEPTEMAKAADVLCVMPGFPHELEDILFGSNGIYPHLKQKSILVDHSTSPPALAKQIFDQCKEKAVSFIDAPVSGGDVGARTGTLTIMCGGEREAFNKLESIFKCYGKSINYMGLAGQGQHTKAANQICIALNMQGVVEALLYAHKANLDLNDFIQAILVGSAGSKVLEALGPRMIKGDFEPGFYVEHFMKDMDIVLNESRLMNLSLPGLALIRQFYEALKAQGGAKEGTQALIKVLEQMNNYSIRK